LKSAGTFTIAELAGNVDSIAWFQVSYQDAFGQDFESSVTGYYKPGVSFAYEFKRVDQLGGDSGA
jgi:hypothetical protein